MFSFPSCFPLPTFDTKVVWNIKSQTQRLVTITPRSDWGGTGLLGVTIRLDDYAEADERLIRVLSVEHNSPASIAGLEPLNDYLLGTTALSFDGDAALASVLRSHADRVVEIYVYNTVSDVVRVVTLMPTLSWGGPGLLGAEVGTGYLHRLPRTCRGTLGSSVERKVRAGSRPADRPPALNSRGGGRGDVRPEAATAARGTHGDGQKGTGSDPTEEFSKEEAELIDLTALGDSAKGMAGPGMVHHYEPKMEMEKDAAGMSPPPLPKEPIRSPRDRSFPPIPDEDARQMPEALGANRVSEVAGGISVAPRAPEVIATDFMSTTAAGAPNSVPAEASPPPAGIPR